MRHRVGILMAVGLLVTTWAGGQAYASTASPKPLPLGPSDPVVTHPVQEPVRLPAGEVCAFPARADFPVSDLTMKTWNDKAGNPVFSLESGPLVMRVTNLATGESVVRDISGSGTVVYPDANSFILSGGDWSASFHTNDRPAHNRWIITRGFMSVKVSTVDGVSSRQLLALRGPFEDLCMTLA